MLAHHSGGPGEYQIGDRVWTHAWAAYQISDDELASDLADADLRFGDWITDDHVWFTARSLAKSQ